MLREEVEYSACFRPQGFTPFYKRWGTEALLELVASGFTIVYSVSRDCICNLEIFFSSFWDPLHTKANTYVALMTF